MHEIKTLLEQHLKKMGLSQNMIPGFLKSISNFFNDHPEMDLSEINEKLQYIGWDGIEMNYHTLELAKAWYETRPAPGKSNHQTPRNGREASFSSARRCLKWV